jgi:hypothetical protein
MMGDNDGRIIFTCNRGRGSTAVLTRSRMNPALFKRMKNSKIYCSKGFNARPNDGEVMLNCTRGDIVASCSQDEDRTTRRSFSRRFETEHEELQNCVNFSEALLTMLKACSFLTRQPKERYAIRAVRKKHQLFHLGLVCQSSFQIKFLHAVLIVACRGRYSACNL